MFLAATNVSQHLHWQASSVFQHKFASWDLCNILGALNRVHDDVGHGRDEARREVDNQQGDLGGGVVLEQEGEHVVERDLKEGKN